MKIKEYFKDSKHIFVAINYIFILALIILKLDLILSYLSQMINLLTPLFYGIMIAYILNIPMTTIEKLIKDKTSNKYINKYLRTLSISLSVIMMIIILGVIGIIIFPELIRSINGLIINLTNLINSAIHNSDKLFKWLNIDVKNIDKAQIEGILKQLGLNYSELINQSTKWVSSLSSNLLYFLNSSATGFGKVSLGFMLSLYLLSAKENFIRQAKMITASILPKEKIKGTFELASKINNTFRSFVGGQLLECFIIGALMYIVLTILQFPFALIIATITAVCALIPIFGAMLSWIIGFFLILSVNPVQALLFLVIYQIIQQFEDNLIYPRIVGKSVGLPALWTLISIIVFGGLFGLIGLIIAVPLTACLYSIISERVKMRLKNKEISIN